MPNISAVVPKELDGMLVAFSDQQMTTRSSAIVATKDQISAQLGGDAVILHLSKGMYYSLNPVGARVWALLQAPTTFPALRDSIIAEYDVDNSRCEQDLLNLLDELEAELLIEV